MGACHAVMQWRMKTSTETGGSISTRTQQWMKHGFYDSCFVASTILHDGGSSAMDVDIPTATANRVPAFQCVLATGIKPRSPTRVIFVFCLLLVLVATSVFMAHHLCRRRICFEQSPCFIIRVLLTRRFQQRQNPSLGSPMSQFRRHDQPTQSRGSTSGRTDSVQEALTEHVCCADVMIRNPLEVLHPERRVFDYSFPHVQSNCVLVRGLGVAVLINAILPPNDSCLGVGIDDVGTPLVQ
mmetsp:Transcript_15067/g.41713  ORF Transcript_15067/g.41713 Transcript_15067/m.41713 type:complete len:240 (-) Transcript_15067:220-939(-)